MGARCESCCGCGMGPLLRPLLRLRHGGPLLRLLRLPHGPPLRRLLRPRHERPLRRLLRRATVTLLPVEPAGRGKARALGRPCEVARGAGGKKIGPGTAAGIDWTHLLHMPVYISRHHPEWRSVYNNGKNQGGHEKHNACRFIFLVQRSCPAPLPSQGSRHLNQSGGMTSNPR